MADSAVSIRLDAEARRALEHLTRSGASRSQVIRDALVAASRRKWREQAEADAKRLAGSETNRAEVARIRESFDEPDWPR